MEHQLGTVEIVARAERALELLALTEPKGADWSRMLADIRAAILLALKETTK